MSPLRTLWNSAAFMIDGAIRNMSTTMGDVLAAMTGMMPLNERPARNLLIPHYPDGHRVGKAPNIPRKPQAVKG